MTNIKEKAPINQHFTGQLARIYEKFKEQYFRCIQSRVDCLRNSESDSFDKIYTKMKVNDLIRLHEAMQGKLKTESY